MDVAAALVARNGAGGFGPKVVAAVGVLAKELPDGRGAGWRDRLRMQRIGDGWEVRRL